VIRPVVLGRQAAAPPRLRHGSARDMCRCLPIHQLGSQGARWAYLSVPLGPPGSHPGSQDPPTEPPGSHNPSFGARHDFLRRVKHFADPGPGSQGAHLVWNSAALPPSREPKCLPRRSRAVEREPSWLPRRSRGGSRKPRWLPARRQPRQVKAPTLAARPRASSPKAGRLAEPPSAIVGGDLSAPSRRPTRASGAWPAPGSAAAGGSSRPCYSARKTCSSVGAFKTRSPQVSSSASFAVSTRPVTDSGSSPKRIVS
jgi:hypothetical protein